MSIQILREMISKVLSEMFYLYEETPVNLNREIFYYMAEVRDDQFEIRILVGKELGKILTSNFLGVEGDLSEEDVNDSLKEILNMIVGNYIGRCYPNFKKNLPIPSTLKIENYCKDATASECNMFYQGLPLKAILLEKK